MPASATRAEEGGAEKGGATFQIYEFNQSSFHSNNSAPDFRRNAITNEGRWPRESQKSFLWSGENYAIIASRQLAHRSGSRTHRDSERVCLRASAMLIASSALPERCPDHDAYDRNKSRHVDKARLRHPTFNASSAGLGLPVGQEGNRRVA
jgi:hypothetical protein